MNTSETLEARNKIGSRGKKREGIGEGGWVFLGIPFMANKQAETRWVQRHTEKQLDNGVDCAAVVKWSGKLSGPVGRSSQERWRDGKRSERHSHFISPPFGRVKQYSTVSFSPPCSERMRRRRGGAEWEKDAKRKGRKWRGINEELKETQRRRIQHLPSNYEPSDYHYNEEVTAFPETWTTTLIGSV